MQSIRIESRGKTTLVDSARIVRLGRAVDSDILLAGDTVSRLHAEIRPTDVGWILVDVGSQHGTYVNGQRITELRITQPLTVFCGLEGSGASVVIEPAAQSGGAAPVTNIAGVTDGRAAPPHPLPGVRPQARPGGPVTPAPGGSGAPWQLDPGLAQTMSAGGGPQGPAGASPAGTGPDLLVRANGKEQRFAHPTFVTIGRHPECTVVISDPVASRYHGRLDAVPGGWTYTNASREGTYVDGRKVDTLKVEDSTTLRLGHPAAGPEVGLTPILAAHVAEHRITRKRRRKRLRVLAAAVLALVLLGGVIFAALLLGDDGDGSNPVAGTDELTSAELDNAKLATVLILAEGQTDKGAAAAWTGSGSILTADGMILTNAHVAEPEADGLAQKYGPSGLRNPDFLQIALIKSSDDAPADPSYRARVVESDGFLDVAVLQIYATIDGGDLPADLDLPTVPVGDSDELRTGDEVTVLGFPSISQSAGVSITRGVISTFVSDPDLGSERAEIDTDARIAPGNSGGLAINNAGQIIGIPSALYAPEGSLVASGRIRSINLVKPIIESAR